MLNLPSEIARRSFLRNSGISLGSMTMGSMLAQLDRKPLSRKSKMVRRYAANSFEPKAKRIIWLSWPAG